MEITRRDLGALVPALLVAPRILRDTAEPVDVPTLAFGAFPYDKIPMHVSNGTESRPVFKGKLPTGEAVEVHETTLPPGGAPHPPHRHEHSEMWLVREGTVEFTVNGNSFRVGPGSVGLATSNDLHGIRNPGDVPAAYFVVAVGPGAAG